MSTREATGGDACGPTRRPVASMPSRCGHAHVHQHDVRNVPPGQLDRLRAIRGLADDLDVVLGLQDHPEPGAHQLLIVDHEDTDRPSCHRTPPVGTAARSSGSRARTRNPPPGCGPASRSPP